MKTDYRISSAFAASTIARFREPHETKRLETINLLQDALSAELGAGDKFTIAEVVAAMRVIGKGNKQRNFHPLSESEERMLKFNMQEALELGHDV
jgi:hypothetical protein